MRSVWILLLAASASVLRAAEPAVERDREFDQERSRQFTTREGLPSNDVRSVVPVALARGVLVATARGLAWIATDGETRDLPGVGPVDRLLRAPGAHAPEDEAFGVAGDTLLRLHHDPQPVRFPSPPLAVAWHTDRLWVVTADALWRLDPRLPDLVEREKTLTRVDWPGIRSLVPSPTGLWIADPTGIARASDGLRIEARHDELPVHLARSASHALAGSPRGALALVGVDSVDLRRSSWWYSHTGSRNWGRLERHELPVSNFTTIAMEDEDEIWLGSKQGVVRIEGWGAPYVTPRIAYRQGRRWLPDDEVRDLAIDDEGRAWIATAGGVAVIERVPMTLAAKAKHFEAEIDRRHRRTPWAYVLGVTLEDPQDPDVFTQHDSDNDGLWTAMYGAGECFAYAATRTPESRRRARQAFEALRFLGEVTQGGEHPAPPGFVARTILPTSGPDPNEGRLEHDREFRATRDRLWKLIEPRWPRSADGKWYWKSDTSSDELDGHFFFYGLYHDLVAETPQEKREVRDVVVSIADHFLRHDFEYIDHDGEPTRWGHFSPRDLNHNPHWWEERGLNSLSMLAYLKVAEHVSGEIRFRDAATYLIDEHAYLTNVLVPKNQWGVGTGNQSDDEMAFMGYWNLLRYETDPERRAVFAYSFSRYRALERPERNPLFDFIYASVVRPMDRWSDPWGETLLAPADHDWLHEGVDTLRRFPIDRRDWRLRNSHRNDIVMLRGESGRGHLRDGRVLPIDERHVVHWNHDPWRLDVGGSGRSLADGAAFLLPYYLGLHAGFLR